jgi:uncharacterized protein YkwD
MSTARRLNVAPLWSVIFVLVLFWLVGSTDTALAVKAGPGPVSCTGHCETCIEFSGPDNVCQKCGIDPKCLGGDPGLSSDFTEMLNAHNGYRARHGTPPLSWSPELAKGAQDWANACTKQHSKDAWQGENGFGENLYWGSGTAGDAKDAVDWWYGEIKNYNFAAPAWSPAVGHFTQVIWKGSKQLGCGAARCGNENYWVCRYSPTGNWNTDKPGVLADNVPPVGGTPQTQSTGSKPPSGGGGNQGGGAPTNVCTVLLSVDLYDAPGGGQQKGVLAAGTQGVTKLEGPNDNWYRIKWPAGEGWVYSGPDYRSLNCP